MSNKENYHQLLIVNNNVLDPTNQHDVWTTKRTTTTPLLTMKRIRGQEKKDDTGKRTDFTLGY